MSSVSLGWHLAGKQVAPDHAQGVIGVFMIMYRNNKTMSGKCQEKKSKK
jgi:hypothetical protein